MREILFRGMRYDNGKWVYGNYIYNPRDEETYIGSYEPKKNVCGLEWNVYRVIPKTVGQFTGLTDKNGTKIFEHDIMKFCDDDGEESYYKIEWNLYRWTVIDEDGNVDGLDKFFCNMSAVVGNIFDNPELLGGDVDELSYISQAGR